MGLSNKAKRRLYPKLGALLKDARNKLRDQHTGQVASPDDMAKLLKVTKGFVYQVEQGKRKPKDSALDRWASVYGVNRLDLWKCLHRIPIDWVAALREERERVPPEPFSQLTETEKSELLPFLEYVKWKIAHQASEVTPYKERPKL